MRPHSRGMCPNKKAARQGDGLFSDAKKRDRLKLLRHETTLAKFGELALKPNDLDGLFGGKENYKIAVNADNLRDLVGTSRKGNELFPWLMFLILALVTAENLLANKFHRDTAAA